MTNLEFRALKAMDGGRKDSIFRVLSMNYRRFGEIWARTGHNLAIYEIKVNF